MNFSNYKITPTISAIITLNIFISELFLRLGVETAWETPILLLNNILNEIAPIMCIVGILFFHDKHGWKYTANLFIKTPDLNGVYEGKIEYNYQAQHGIKNCTIRIRQTASKIQISSEFSKEGENDTKSFDIDAYFKIDDMREFLYYYYENIGSGKYGDTLNKHGGFNIFEIKRKGKKITLDGSYFTDRGTKGIIKVSKKIPKKTFNIFKRKEK